MSRNTTKTYLKEFDIDAAQINLTCEFFNSVHSALIGKNPTYLNEWNNMFLIQLFYVSTCLVQQHSIKYIPINLACKVEAKGT